MLRKLKYLLLIYIIIQAPVFVFAQEAEVLLQQVTKSAAAVKYAEQNITANELKKIIYTLASDEFEGRETGEKGEKLAADYIADYFQKANIPPYEGTYFQEFNLTIEYPENVTITAGGKEYKFMQDFYFFRGFGDTVINHNQIVFAGYGIDDEVYTDYKDKKSLEGKILMVLSGEPKEKKGNYILSGTKIPSEWTSNWRKKANAARQNNAAALLIVTDNFSENIERYEHQLTTPGTQLTGTTRQSAGMPVIYISPSMADKILGPANLTVKKMRTGLEKKNISNVVVNQPVSLNINRKKDIKTGSNVIAYIEGTDLKDELIVLTAHYDHLGIIDGKIYNGADDNASGTAAIMTIAAAFAQAKSNGNAPRRSVLVMPVSGEEKGLFGSRFYVENPLFPLEKTIANLNTDMIGRIDTAYKDDPNYIYLIGSDRISTDLHLLSENVNSTYSNLKLDYTFNSDDDPNRFYYRSDHYNFAKNDIPVIFYFNGVHEDYHEHTDTPDKLHYGKIENIGRLIFYTAWELANMGEPLIKDKLKENQ
ncbi:MAG: M28 family peptidase [Bacteroidia bacterium]